MGAFDLGVGETADTAQRYFETARTIFKETLLEEGSIELVQALAIMGNYLQRRDTPNSGYMCLGLAIRMATALGLHNPSARQEPSPLDDEMRHRIWWGLVTLEAGCSLTFGRPPMLGYASLLTSRIPANVDDEDLRVGSMQPAQESAGVTLYSAVITQARLAKVAFFLQDRLARSLPAPTVAQIQWCGEYFRREVALLPPGPVSPDEPFALARAVQIWRMRDYQSVIYRPVFLASAWDPQSRSDADSRVKAIIRCVVSPLTLLLTVARVGRLRLRTFGTSRCLRNAARIIIGVASGIYCIFRFKLALPSYYQLFGSQRILMRRYGEKTWRRRSRCING
jgi:transcriptional regulatory protein GAL4